jgi:hypothetical protein
MKDVPIRLPREPIAKGEALDAELQFSLVVDHVIDYAIFLLDRDGRVATWNTGAERIKV